MGNFTLPQFFAAKDWIKKNQDREHKKIMLATRVAYHAKEKDFKRVLAALSEDEEEEREAVTEKNAEEYGLAFNNAE